MENLAVLCSSDHHQIGQEEKPEHRLQLPDFLWSCSNWHNNNAFDENQLFRKEITSIFYCSFYSCLANEACQLRKLYTNSRLTGLSSLHLTTLTITNSWEAVGGRGGGSGGVVSRVRHVTTSICTVHLLLYFNSGTPLQLSRTNLDRSSRFEKLYQKEWRIYKIV